MSAPSDVMIDTRKFLLALFVDLATDKNFKPRFRAAHRDLHQFFWRLKQEDRSRGFVEDLLFDTNGNYPHCDQIDELLQEFQLSGVLSRPNPTYKFNDIAITRSQSRDDFLKGLPQALEKDYLDVVNRFKQDLGERAT